MQVECEECGIKIDEITKICQNCAYPQNGDNSDKMHYNVLKIDMKSWQEQVQKSVKSILSIAIIFAVMASIVVFFSFYFQEDHYQTGGIFLLLGILYLLLYKVAGRNPTRWIALTLIFYLVHTILEIMNGMMIRDIMVDEQAQGIFAFLPLLSKIFPLLYLLLRLLIPVAFIKGLYYIFKVGQHPVMAKHLSESSPQV